MSTQFAYRSFHGSYQLIEVDSEGNPVCDAFGNVKIRCQSEELAFAFDYSVGVLLKHGRPKTVRTWLTEAKKRTKLYPEFMGDVLIITSSVISAEEATKIINISGYIKTYYDNQKEN